MLSGNQLIHFLVKKRKTLIFFIIVLFIIIQILPVNKVNPSVVAEINVPSDVQLILKRACYDCHSNETKWPWYSQIAPFSWLMNHHVNEGREYLNFSEWGKLSQEKQVKLLEEIWEEIEEGEMPPWYYVPAHPEAQIKSADRQAIKKWLEQ